MYAVFIHSIPNHSSTLLGLFNDTNELAIGYTSELLDNYELLSRQKTD
jgi:hypothetical protein